MAYDDASHELTKGLALLIVLAMAPSRVGWLVNWWLRWRIQTG